MAAIDDLKTALQALANDLDDTVRKNTALVLIDQYIDALSAQATATSTDIQSYTIGGRTVTRQQVEAMANSVSNLQKQLNDIFYGNTSYADFNVQVNQRYQ